MKIEKNFTTGILSGVCGILLLLLLTSTTTNEMPMYEFYDLEDTRGLIFNKATGEINYEEIRENPLQNVQEIKLTNWNGEKYGSRNLKFFD